ncbi:hypothetical protein ACQKWADRAFT_330313 [Trichoderma austrokoningii]
MSENGSSAYLPPIDKLQRGDEWRAWRQNISVNTQILDLWDYFAGEEEKPKDADEAKKWRKQDLRATGLLRICSTSFKRRNFVSLDAYVSRLTEDWNKIKTKHPNTTDMWFITVALTDLKPSNEINKDKLIRFLMSQANEDRSRSNMAAFP